MAPRPGRAGLAAQGGVAAALELHLERCALRGAARHNVDGSAEGLTAKHTRGGTFEYLHTVHVAEVKRKVRRVVTGLRVNHGNAVDQQCDLVEGAAVDADVGLHAKCSALAYVDTGRKFEKVVDGAYARRLQVAAGERNHLPCRHIGGEGGA